MAKSTSVYVCQQCGYRSSQYLGKCPQCDNWNSLVEEIEESQRVNSLKIQRKAIEIINLSDIEKKDYDRLSTKIIEFDRVLGGGIVKGSIILVSGDPGIGKSTLLTQLAINFDKSLYVAGEESAHQIKIRVDRMKPKTNLNLMGRFLTCNI